MELIAIVFMLVAGGAVATFVLTAFAIAQKESAKTEAQVAAPERDQIAASILVHILVAGGTARDEALRMVRRGSGIAAPVTQGIDIANWAESYARLTTQEQRAALLETAVQLVATKERAVPLRQYTALLDLSFALGFQTDALAKLRQVYGFDYVDAAKAGRPRDAEGKPLFARSEETEGELLRVLEVEGTPSRQSIITAYRRLAARHHPDRFFGRPAEEQTSAAARFIEITRAYETLLTIYRD
ncbi:MAG TPA: J domain-containing protein [Thermoanaerobaculia bacterium]